MNIYGCITGPKNSRAIADQIPVGTGSENGNYDKHAHRRPPSHASGAKALSHPPTRPKFKATAGGLTMVTFNNGFRQYPNVTLQVLNHVV